MVSDKSNIKKANSSPGDLVKIITKEEIFEGILMPRPELLDNSIVVLKQKTGYNIGIESKKIMSIDIIKKYSSKSKKSESSEKINNSLPTVSILSCGGTISSKIDYLTGGVSADYSAEDFIAMEPKLKNIANIKTKKLMSIMSEDLVPKDWKKMAKGIYDELKESDAVIVTHGTDTMHYSTALMSFFLKNLNKPVIFTGAQRSIDRGSSDAFMNLLCSVKTAVKFDGAGVYLVMHGSSSDDYCLIHKGTKVRKMHSLRRDAFRSINEMPIAKVYFNSDNSKGDIEYLHNNYNKKLDVSAKMELDDSFEEKTALVYVYPGMEPKIIDFYIDNKYKGIVLIATALGHVPTMCDKNIMKQLDRAKKENVSIVVTTQCLYGRVDPLVYGNLRRLSIDKDVIFVEDMLPEVAYLKLGYVLSKVKTKSEIKEMMQTNLVGEINKKHNPNSFLN